MRRLRERLFAALLTLGCLAPTGCSRGVLIAEYPVDNSVPPPLSGGVEDGLYWSAYVRIENQDVPHLWEVTALDYAIISVEVSIPTREGPVVRTIPLFTLERGAVRVETGADLLRKIPLMQDARDQVSFQLRVTYLKNREALEKATKILTGAKKLAEPFLSSYPVASQIMETSLNFIHDTVDLDERPVSSTTWFVEPRELYKDAFQQESHNDPMLPAPEDPSVLRVFFLIPINLWLGRGAGENDTASGAGTDCGIGELSVETCGVKRWLDNQIGKNKRIFECIDMPGRLCLVDANDQKEIDRIESERRSRSLAWIKFAFDEGEGEKGEPLPAYDFAGLLRKVQGEVVVVEPGDIDDEVRNALGVWIEAYNKSRAKVCPPTEQPQPPECVPKDNLIKMAQHLHLAANQLVREALYANQRLEALAEQSKSRNYRQSRLDSVVYVTVSFEPFFQVYDPNAVIPGLAISCQGITEDSIDSMQEYFGANVDFFTETDGDRIRGILRMARAYVQLTGYVDRKAFGEALRVLDEAETLLTNDSQAWENNIWGGGSAVTPYFKDTTEALQRCFGEVEAKFPLQQYRALQRIQRGELPAQGRTSTNVQCQASTSVRRLDLASMLFAQVAAGLDLEPFSAHAPTTSALLRADQPELSILLRDLASTHAEQLAFAKSIGCPTPTELNQLSLACGDCFTAVASACEKNKDESRLTPLTLAIQKVARRECLDDELQQFVGESIAAAGDDMFVDLK